MTEEQITKVLEGCECNVEIKVQEECKVVEWYTITLAPTRFRALTKLLIYLAFKIGKVHGWVEDLV